MNGEAAEAEHTSLRRVQESHNTPVHSRVARWGESRCLPERAEREQELPLAHRYLSTATRVWGARTRVGAGWVAPTMTDSYVLPS